MNTPPNEKTSILQNEINQLGPWFHNIHLPDGTQTAPDHFLGNFPQFKWNELEQYIPKDLSGWKVLDIGCNAGFYSIELAKRGASVLAIDLDPHYLKQANWVARQFKLEKQITFSQMQIYDLVNINDDFDIVWFMGVFYHLRYPVLGLDIVAEKTKKMMVFQTLSMPDNVVQEITDNYNINDREKMNEAGWPKMAFIEKKLNGDLTNWWAPNRAAIEALMRTCGLEVVHRPGKETYICQPSANGQAVSKDWNRSEFLSATGRDWKNHLEAKTSGK